MDKKFKFITIVLLAVTIRIVLQKIFGEDPLAAVLPYSALVNKISMPAVAGPMIFLAYFLLAFLFIKIQKSLPGTKVQKGLLYGIIFGVLWVNGMIEGNIELNASLSKEIIFGLLEMIPLITLSVLIGISFAENSKDTIGALLKKFNFSLVGGIALFYILGRYFTYMIIGVDSAYLSKTIPLFLWCAGNGIIIGSMYYFLGYKIAEQAYVKKAFFFSFIIFGTDWMIFQLFLPFVFKFSFFNVICRPVFDILFVFFGAVFYEFVANKIRFTADKKSLLP